MSLFAPNRRTLLAGAAASIVAGATTAWAYPHQMIKIVVTFPPGGSADIFIRALEPIVTADLKQGFVIENRGGAGGNIGMQAVMQAKPDGYTLGVAPAGALTINPHLNPSTQFDPIKDLVPITLLADIPFVLVANADAPFATLKEALAAATAKPGQLSIGYGGNGTVMHMTAALLLQSARIKLTLVPYRGTGPVVTDVLAGHIPLAVLDIPSSLELIRAGRLKPLGVTSAKRVSFLRDVPTLAEQGVTGFESTGWFGLVAPAATPGDIVARLNGAFVKALGDPDVIEKLRTIGAQPAPSTIEAFAAYIRSESDKWGHLTRDMNLSAQ
ncbi:Bug family tripartite tricarboxylate transporter substrate binding protein [Rhodopseudomonas sp. P2A-2r]|uniref:Bug family tripartite tricarboxylate transporter substrate binding protein n=1 Tax=unclassified Rhodopseudomonas TaxID=2638247 RepID=UPI002233EFD7|nr:tripartite tricarboxylate transporter substrate binding protein [Rhodopseudomonas sp. P2A-2r]UZE48837.1 tripartite tricarboxylate transporter substrate binding protein [Rhodopseudomonas sp. P2A-2r]